MAVHQRWGIGMLVGEGTDNWHEVEGGRAEGGGGRQLSCGWGRGLLLILIKYF